MSHSITSPPPGDSPQFQKLLTIRAAAEATGIRYWLLLRAVNGGEIPSYMFGNKRRRVRLADIEAVIARSVIGEAQQ